MLKKLLALLLGGCLLCSALTACTPSPVPPANSTTVAAQTTADPTPEEPTTATLRVMSFNIWGTMAKNGDGSLTDATKNRIIAIRQEILNHNPDVLGLQEDAPAWIDVLDLEEHGYTVLYDNTIASGENCSIWYKSDMKLLESGSFWLTDSGEPGAALTIRDLFEENGAYQLSAEYLTQLQLTSAMQNTVLTSTRRNYIDDDGVLQSSGGYQYLNKRRMTYAVFEIEGQPVLYVNTHLQHRSPNADYATKAFTQLRNLERIKQFHLIQKQIAIIESNYEDLLVTISGDFNDIPDSDIHKEVLKSYTDTSLVAKKSFGYTQSSMNLAFEDAAQGDNYPSPNETKRGNKLDYIFISKEGFTVAVYRTCSGKATITAVDGTQKTIYTSDHCPILTDLQFPAKPNS
ncbi:MAG: endonuclease/exonuclease/phosphatase family protein [Clostridia bacterium]|nr:endonuclease/exonuclease/phosphatase family protein [Clostridia bacterium]